MNHTVICFLLLQSKGTGLHIMSSISPITVSNFTAWGFYQLLLSLLGWGLLELVRKIKNKDGLRTVKCISFFFPFCQKNDMVWSQKHLHSHQAVYFTNVLKGGFSHHMELQTMWICMGPIFSQRAQNCSQLPWFKHICTLNMVNRDRLESNPCSPIMHWWSNLSLFSCFKYSITN